MKRISSIIISLLFAFVSCEKEKFPKKNDLIGSWIEQTDYSFKTKLIFEEETMCFFRPTEIDTFFYWLDKKQGYLFLEHRNTSVGSFHHKISLEKKKKELTIWNLYPSIPEEPSETVFKKGW